MESQSKFSRFALLGSPVKPVHALAKVWISEFSYVGTVLPDMKSLKGRKYFRLDVPHYYVYFGVVVVFHVVYM